MSDVTKPIVGDGVRRMEQQIDESRRLQLVDAKGEVVSVTDHPEAMGGWIAVVLWRRPRRDRFSLHEAWEFGEEHPEFGRVRVVPDA